MLTVLFLLLTIARLPKITPVIPCVPPPIQQCVKGETCAPLPTQCPESPIEGR